MDEQPASASVDGPWDGDVAAARALQVRLAGQVSLVDGWPRPLHRVAGFDVGFEDEGRTTRAAVVLLDAGSGQPLEWHVARLPTRMPYIPGLLSFRELPALLAALDALRERPDLAFVDGHGIAHPRRLGIAAHFGVATGLPSLGVAKKRLYGRGAEPGPQRGDHTPLLDRDGTPLGWVLRSKPRCLPLYVSPGHRVGLASSLALTREWLHGYRLPAPTWWADRLASRRGAMPARNDPLPLR